MVFAAPFGRNRRDRQRLGRRATRRPPAYDEGSLLEAFCDGARLDVSALSGEEPAEIMRRAGAIYRQMVLGLGDLVSAAQQRQGRSQHGPHDDRRPRTTIRSNGRRAAAWRSICCSGREAGFLPGPEAIRASFEDVKTHMLGTLAGFEAAMRAVLDIASPAVDRRARRRTERLSQIASGLVLDGI